MSDFVKHEYLQEIAETIIKRARQKGADQAATSLGRSEGVSINVRQQALETFEHIQNQSASIQIYLNHKKALVSTSDFSLSAIDQALDAAFNIAQYTAADPDFYLVEKEHLAFNYPQLPLDFNNDASHQSLIDTAIECESAALNYDAKISNSDGASIDSSRATMVYANSHGFNGHNNTSRNALSCSVIAGKGANMQQDYHYTFARDPEKLESAATIGKIAAKRTIDKLDARAVKTGNYPIIFSADIAGGLFRSFFSAVSGSALYKNLSFLPDSLDTKIFPEFIHLSEVPHLASGMASTPFDGEGVKTKNRTWVESGIVKSYVLNSYTGRKLGLTTTGNAGGIHNLLVETSSASLQELQKNMGRGLYITSLMGNGINGVTGDYSQGASGFWVDGGQIQYPVDEITIAGNLKQMYQNIIQIANDVDLRHNIQTGSILLEGMTISGDK